MAIELPKPIAVTPVPNVRYREFTKCGQKPLAGGQIWTYEANSTTPKITYQDPYGMTPNTNPIILDAAGEADIYLNGTYRFVVKDKNGIVQKDVGKLGSWFSGDLADQMKSVNDALEASANTLMQPLQDAIDSALAAGAGDAGWSANLIADGSENQAQINKKTVRHVECVADLLLIKNPSDGQTVYSRSYHLGLKKGGATYVYDSSQRAINNGVTVISGWLLQYLDRICVTQAGCKLDGDTDDSLAFNTCSDLNVPMRISVSGRLKALTPLKLNFAGLIGCGIFCQIDVIGGHDGLILPLGGGRLFNNVEKFFIMSSDNSAQNHIAIRSAEITNTAAQSLGNGFKIRDIEIGGGGRFGVGIALTDCFRTTISDIGMTSCANAVVLYGRVVQCKIGVVNSNSDEFGDGTYTTTALNKLGNISAKIDATKRYGLLVIGSNHTGSYQYPESIKSRDNAYVKHHYGLYHYDGLFCSYKDIDLDYNLINGAYFFSCNGLVTLDTAWIAQNVNASHGIVVETSTTEAKRLVLRGIHGFSYGALQDGASVIYQSSDGINKPARKGLEINGVTLSSNNWTHGIDFNRMGNFTLKNYIEEGTPIGTGVDLKNCSNFEYSASICKETLINTPTGDFKVARITGNITYLYPELGTGERVNSKSYGVHNKTLELIAYGGAWKAPIKFGSGGFLWIAADGKLMKKTGTIAPISDADGTVIFS